MLRTEKLKWLNISMANATNDQIIEIFNIFVKDIECAEKKLNRRTRINHMLTNFILADDKTIDDLYNYGKDNGLLNNSGIYFIKFEKKRKERDDTKYTITLNIINGMLEVMNMPRIDRLDQFIDIKRDELENPKCIKIIVDNIDYILTKYTRTQIRYKSRNKVNAYVVCAIRGMIKQLDGYKVVPTNHKNKKILKKGDKVNYTTYSIIKTMTKPETEVEVEAEAEDK